MNTRHEQFHLAIAGACGRGLGFRNACDALPRIRVHAVCDIDAEALPATAELLGASEQVHRSTRKCWRSPTWTE